jgi:hypothetical protein
MLHRKVPVRIIAPIALAWLASLWPGPRVHAGDFCDSLPKQLLEQSAGRTVVRLQTDPNAPLTLDPTVFAVALPGPEMPRLQVLELRTGPVEGMGSEQALPAEPVHLEPPARYRAQWLTRLRVSPVIRPVEGAPAERILELVLAIEHPEGVELARRASGGIPESALEGRWYEGVALNGDAAAQFRAGARVLQRNVARQSIGDTFARSPRWLRIEVDRTGVHRLDYEAVRSVLGAGADLIRPESLRIFSRGRALQPRLPEDPAGSWTLQHEMVEHDILVRAAGTSWAPGDEVFFYAGGPQTWTDRFDPDASLRDHFESEYADRLAYWLTWDELGGDPGAFAGEPRRMVRLSVTPTGAAADYPDHGRSRLQIEQNLAIAYGVVRDNWVWAQRIQTEESGEFGFQLTEVVSDSIGWLYTEPYMDPPSRGGAPLHVARYSLNGLDVPSQPFTWTLSAQSSRSQAPIRLLVPVSNLREGTNLLRVRNESSLNSRGLGPEMVIDAFSLSYRRWLRPVGGRIEWSIFPDEVPDARAVGYRLRDPQARWGTAFLLDVSDPRRPRFLEGGSQEEGGTVLRIEVAAEAARPRHFVCVLDPGTSLRPIALQARRPRLLRAELSGPGGEPEAGWDMVILHPATLRGAAEALAEFRSLSLPDRTAPRVSAVDLQDVYDQFGHGVKEPTALRNYLKFLYEVDRSFEFVVLLGDANRDYRGRVSSAENDLCPTWIQTLWPSPATSGTSNVPYAYDDWFASLDDPPASTGVVYLDLPDLAIGRLPASDPAEANLLVQRIQDYEHSPPSGTWRNEVLLVADDDVGLAGPNYRESMHVDEAECLGDYLLPPEIDVEKLYLTEFPVAVEGARAKPSARQAMRDRWSEALLIVHYIGHGSPEQMADEAVFRIEDVAALDNRDRLPLFLAFSCDVAIFDSPSGRSMSEQLVLDERGGAIATIAATQVTFIDPNEDLTETFYPFLYPDRQIARSQPVGRALTQAKVNTPGSGVYFVQHNNAKYVLLGDPALRLQSAEGRVELSGTLASSIPSSRLESIGADIGAEITAGRYWIDARESADSTVYIMSEGPPSLTPLPLPYVLPGSSFFRGTGTFSGAGFEAALRTPNFMRFGGAGRVRVLVESDGSLRVGAANALSVVAAAPDSDDQEGPRIDLGFENDATQVTAGSVLRVSIEDPSGINVLGTVPGNSILLEFDRSGIGVDVSGLFALDEGSFSRGTLEFKLPDVLSAGAHVLNLSAADMLGNVSVAELEFAVIEAGGIDIVGHAPFPNPFSSETRFVIELTSPAATRSEVELEIYALDGSPVQSLRSDLEGSGKLVIPWDGRDRRGDEISNGTYVYTVRARFGTSPPVTEVVTGKVVRMR